MPVKIEMMRCFRAVAGEGTLARAAEVLGRTPSAISMMLSQFEEQIGAALFETDRKNRLTPFGLRVLEECERALEAFDRSATAIGRHARSTAGTVRLSAVPSAAATILPRAIALFSETRPDVLLEVSDVDSATVRRRLQFDDADIGIVSARNDTATDGQVLVTDRLGIVCREDSPIMTQEPGWEALAADRFIYNPLCKLVDHPVVHDLSSTGSLSAHNTTTLLSFVRNGLGATILPSRGIEDGLAGIAFVVPENPVATRHLVVLTNNHRRLSPAVEAFLEALGVAASGDDRPKTENPNSHIELHRSVAR